MKAANAGFGFKLLLILPAIVLLASGCTTDIFPTTGATGQGIVITTFEPSLSSIESGDDVTLHLEVQNMGSVVGTAAAKLIGIHTPEWNVFLSDQAIGELLPADEERNVQGQKGEVYWDLRAPELERGQSRPYYPIARVFYSYETRATKPILFVTSDEQRNMVISGDTLQSEPAIVTSGPVSMNIQVGEFVRVNEESWDQSYFPVDITITNTGGGLIAGENYPIGIEVINPPGTIFRGDCPRSTQYEWANYDAAIPTGLTRPMSPKTIRLWNGRETSVRCELKVIDQPDAREIRDLQVVLKYIYYQDQKVPLTVVGTREWGY